jgi:hypothetical protein
MVPVDPHRTKVTFEIVKVDSHKKRIGVALVTGKGTRTSGVPCQFVQPYSKRKKSEDRQQR